MKGKENEQAQTDRNQKSSQRCSSRNRLCSASSQRDQLCWSATMENMKTETLKIVNH